MREHDSIFVILISLENEWVWDTNVAGKLTPPHWVGRVSQSYNFGINWLRSGAPLLPENKQHGEQNIISKEFNSAEHGLVLGLWMWLSPMRGKSSWAWFNWQQKALSFQQFSTITLKVDKRLCLFKKRWTCHSNCLPSAMSMQLQSNTTIEDLSYPMILFSHRCYWDKGHIYKPATYLGNQVFQAMRAVTFEAVSHRVTLILMPIPTASSVLK